MTAALVILACFSGLSLLAATVMTGVMLAVGRWTLPSSPERRIREAEATAQIAGLRHGTLLMEERIDALIESRLQRALGPGNPT